VSNSDAVDRFFAKNAAISRLLYATSPNCFDDLRRVYDQRGKIFAIKYIRSQIGCGLYVAKEFVESFEVLLRDRDNIVVEHCYPSKLDFLMNVNFLVRRKK
jgi:hypothetical protein